MEHFDSRNGFDSKCMRFEVSSLDISPYVLVTPDETRRKKLQQIAKKELDDLERWKEDHRPGPITLVPQRLGGKESEAQARQKQQMMLMQSKYQQKHKREEYVKAKKAAEEAEILKKKTIQREKERKKIIEVGVSALFLTPPLPRHRDLKLKKDNKKCKEERRSLKINIKNGVYVLTFYQKLPTHEVESVILSHDILNAFYLMVLMVFLSGCMKSKTNELLNRLDVGLPKSDSCQIANPGPESTAWG
ncbi:Epithelial-stromal interaction protein 1 [Pitangus sulphuratus]|nr:Epithelial-stromal interaction protein 1 [Pitangus sulphuratus]